MTAVAGLLLLFVVAVVMNGLFAGYETGFVASNAIRLRHMAEKGHDLVAARLVRHYDNPGRLITMLLVGTNLFLIIGTVSLTAAVGGTWATIIATPVFVFFAEVLPKSVFRLHATHLSLRLYPVIRVFDMLFTPVVAPMYWLSDGIARLFGENGASQVLFSSREEVRVMVDESTDRGSIDPEEQEMIHSVIDLQTRLAKNIMVPRIHIQALPETATRAELVTLLKESGKTRIPVYSGTIDRITGVVNAFDVLTDRAPEKPGIGRFIRNIMHVPDTMKLDDLLQAMRRARQSMAVVTDEFGGTDGVISIEDILEEIFGEIHDEYDVQQPQVRRIGPNAYVVDALMPLEDCADAVGMEIIDEDVETVGGWICHIAGRIPARGEVVRHVPFQVTVLEGTPTHVASIRLEIQRPQTSAEESGASEGGDKPKVPAKP